MGSDPARRDNFSMPSSYSTCPGLSIKWTGRRLVEDSGTMCVWVIHESKAVQIHVHNNCCCLYVPPRVPDSLKNLHQPTEVHFTPETLTVSLSKSHLTLCNSGYVVDITVICIFLQTVASFHWCTYHNINLWNDSQSLNPKDG